ncbi:MAG: aminoacyl-tRNA hydrolase [Desulfobacterales bacterium]|nr:MAG: aminoacyl-tRNA hydrolase [Desulfobacterales bacterium]
MIQITETIALDSHEIQLDFIRSSGPGGQNVNKVSSAVQLRFDVVNSSSLSNDIRQRLIRLAGKQMTADGVLIIKAQRFRSQERNRQDVVSRLIRLVRRAAEKPKVRLETRPTLASKHRRLKAKRQRSLIKYQRRTVTNSGD